MQYFREMDEISWVYLQKSVKSMRSVGLKYILTDFWRQIFFQKSPKIRETTI